MRNEYTDYIAHGHKYFAVVDIGKKNSKGTKLRRYFYSANEYKNYLAGKKTLDDKLLSGVSKAYNKAKGLSAVAKSLPKLARAVKETSKMTEGERIEKNVQTRAKRAGLTVSTNATYTREERPDRQYNEAHDAQGNRYLISRKDRKIYAHDGKPYGNGLQVMKDADEGKSKDESKNLIRNENQAKKERNKPSEIFRRTIKVPDQGPAITKLPKKVGEAIDKTVGAKVRENFIERMVEKGINKANAEAMRKKLEETYERATNIGTSANNLKNRLDNLQEAFTSGDGDKALDAIDETLKDQEAIQKDILTIVDEMMPEAKKVADTFVDMGKKTLDTATAGPKAIVDEVKTNVNYGKSIGPVKPKTTNTPTVNNLNKTTTFDDAVKNGKTKVENAINNASSKPKETTTNKETNSKTNSKYYVEYKAGDSKKEWIDKMLELSDSINDKYKAEYKAAKKEKDKEKMAKIKEEWNAALDEAEEVNRDTVDSMGYNVGDLFYTMYKDLTNNLSRK